MGQILLIEPSAPNVDIFRKSFKSKKHTLAKVCSCGKEALAAVKEIRPEMVLMCVGAPDVVGGKCQQAVGIIKKMLEIDPKLRIIVTYTKETEHLVAPAIAAGAEGKLEKPFKKGVLEKLFGEKPTKKAS